ncbi:hypothetical protein J1N35_025261 [Gossypium stocksii]|uniref:Uncharacterized protein n=1 Tax=Gossypium stocksii TaxID=47602 RepID=A0A9D3ZY39_9ROSI|nr:hypothetical protein J1N35_025261 [Gossypium stocksii]
MPLHLLFCSVLLEYGIVPELLLALSSWALVANKQFKRLSRGRILESVELVTVRNIFQYCLPNQIPNAPNMDIMAILENFRVKERYSVAPFTKQDTKKYRKRPKVSEDVPIAKEILMEPAYKVDSPAQDMGPSHVDIPIETLPLDSLVIPTNPEPQPFSSIESDEFFPWRSLYASDGQTGPICGICASVVQHYHKAKFASLEESNKSKIKMIKELRYNE